MRRAIILAGMLMGWACAAAAQPVSGATARGMLFNAGNYQIVGNAQSGLSPAQVNFIAKDLFDNLRRAAGFKPMYYGAVAVSPVFFNRLAESPQTAAMTGLLQVVADYHSPASADRAALTACEAARSRNQPRCVIAARVFPRSWKPHPLSLSSSATAGFNSSYGRGSGPKAMAISPATGRFSIARGNGADARALADCTTRARAAGASDCAVVIRD